jgi:hypothetical protein
MILGFPLGKKHYLLIKRNIPIPTSIAITRTIIPAIIPIIISLKDKR